MAFFFFFLVEKKEERRRKKGKHNAVRAHGINRMVLINVHTSKAREKEGACYTARTATPHPLLQP